ncbi:hypothetical protein QQ045_004224 [Rhodiola kirilowii]
MEEFLEKAISAKVPNKVKMHNWRLFHGDFLDALGLVKRGIGKSMECTLCGVQPESVNHFNRECWWGQCLWKLLGVEKLVHVCESRDAADFLWTSAFQDCRGEFDAVLLGSWLI